MPFPRSLLVPFVAASLAVLSACGGPRLAADSPPAAELRGTWRLDPAASDDAEAIIAAALPKPRRTTPPRQPPPDAPPRADGSAAPPPRGTAVREEPEFGAGSARTFARAFAAPATMLRIGGSPREIEIDQDGRRRRLAPGDETPFSVTDRFGTRRVSSGWERDEFVIVSRNSSGFEVVERFRRGTAPDTLTTAVTLKARGLDSIRVRSLYRRAPDVPYAPSAADGPPAPLR
jgi:hypothetical protein